MIAERTKALLNVAAVIYTGSWVPGHWTRNEEDWVGGIHALSQDEAVEHAYALLARIEAREKAQYGTREPQQTTKCYGCGCSGASNCVCPKEG